jgi:hypothetical protein
MSVFRVKSLTAGGVELGAATASLGRGRGGLKNWSVGGSYDAVGPMPEDTTVTLELADGRTLTGHGLLKNHRITSNARGTYTDYTYLGTGPLDGAVDQEFD